MTIAFFHVARVAQVKLRAPRLALAVLVWTLQHLHFEQLFHRPLDVAFVGQAIHFERVRVVPRRTVHPLFRHQRPEHDLVRLEVEARGLWYVAWHGCLLY